ncbi:MAG: class I SAM-dependent methyltransferase, partial [Cyanobacteriota bacterium]|nr:class I SAM-dependent methyltransferase [Cyanobacteriota bacterium]
MYAEAVGAILDRQQYKFAKSMPWLPHWYTLKSTWENPFLYEQVISWILRNGQLRSWGKAPAIRRYFDHNGYRYWPMTTDPKQSILLNRALISSDSSRPWSPPSDPYDDVAGSYDELWGSPDALQEDQELMALLDYESGSVLDIGCGTGLFLDHHPEAQSYFGCDPSSAMLQRLHAKHPGAITYPLTFEQCLPALKGTKYDHIISLFGSPS